MNLLSKCFNLIVILVLGAQIAACGKLTEEVDNSFVIGGKAFGLVNTVELLNNSTNETIIISGGNKPNTKPADETSFNFTTQSSFSADYNVTIKTQPKDPEQTCVVHNGVGKVGNTDITHIAIVCTTTQFTLGGTVTGLPSPLGQGLSIRTHNQDLLRIDTNAAFTFRRQNGLTVLYDDHSDYTVEIITQPDSPALLCSLTNDTGKIQGDNVTNISINCQDIYPPTIIKTTPINASSGISRASPIEIFFSELLDIDALNADINASLILKQGTTLIPATVIYTESKQLLSIKPDTALSPNTIYTVTIGNNVTDKGTIGVPDSGNPPAADFSLTFTTADGLWNQAELIEDQFDTAILGDLAVDSNGNMIAVWEHSNSGRHNIYANYYTAGTGWGTEVLIETLDQTANNPRVIFDSLGNATAVWQQAANGESNSSIWANRYIVGSGWGTAQLIESENLGSAHNPELTIIPNNGVVVVWSQSNGTAFQIYSSRYTAGSWQTSTPLTSNTANQNARKPKLATTSNNQIFVVWQQTSIPYSNIYAARFDTNWQPPQLINNTNEGDAYNPEITIDGSNNAYVVWEQSDGLRYNIVGNRFLAAATAWGSPFNIESMNAGDALNIKLASASTGSIIAVWQQHNGVTFSIWSNNITTTSIGTEQLLSNAVDLDATNPQIIFNTNNSTGLAIWLQDSGDIIQLIASRYSGSPIGTWGEPEVISFANLGDANEARLRLGPSTSSSIIWSESDGTDNNIYVNQYSIP